MTSSRSAKIHLRRAHSWGSGWHLVGTPLLVFRTPDGWRLETHALLGITATRWVKAWMSDRGLTGAVFRTRTHATEVASAHLLSDPAAPSMPPWPPVVFARHDDGSRVSRDGKWEVREQSGVWGLFSRSTEPLASGKFHRTARGRFPTLAAAGDAARLFSTPAEPVELLTGSGSVRSADGRFEAYWKAATAEEADRAGLGVGAAMAWQVLHRGREIAWCPTRLGAQQVMSQHRLIFPTA